MPYIGQPPVSGDTTKSFRLLDNLASFTLSFDATSSSVVDTTANTLTFANHRFVTAQRVTYADGGGTAIGGLTDGTAYFIIKVDQNTIQLASSASNANNGTAISLSSGAVGSHTLNLAFDGTNTKFKATYANGTKAKISRAGQLLISINGVLQQAQESSTPTLGFGLDSDSTIVFSQAPVSTDVLFGQILADTITNFDTQDNTLDVFTGDGSTTTFNLSKKPASNNDILVTLDGVVQYPTTTSTSNAYSVTESTLTFTAAPADGVAIQVRHIGFAGATTSAVTGLYGRTGNVTLSSSDDDITVGNVTAGIITATSYGSISGTTASFSGNVSIGGTLTYEDVTNIDSVGLITARNGIKVDDLGVQVGTGATVDSAAANTLTFLTGGSERARIDSSGNFGIGTDSPATALHVSGSGTQRIRITGTGTANAILTLDAPSSYANYIEYGASASTPLAFYDLANSSERMRIDSSGNVQVAAGQFTVGTTASTGLQFINDGTFGTIQSADLKIRTAATERLRITTTARFGFNTANPPRDYCFHSGQADTNIQITNNTTGVDDSAGALIQQDGNDLYIWNKENSFFSFGTNASEQMRLDSSGRLLIGTTTEGHPSGDDLTVATTANTGITIRSGTSNYGAIFFSDGTSGNDEYRGYIEYEHSSNYMRFGTNASERTRIDQNGTLSHGTTTENPGDANTTAGIAFRANGKYFFSCAADGGHINRNNTGYVLHTRNNGNHVGGVYVTSSATSYQTSSDYRLKENVVDLDGAITRVKQLAPKRFNFISDANTTVDGFLAHEAQTVVPEAVTGTHNEVDDDGNAVMQGIDTSKLVPLLTAALQEAVAKIEILETKVAALEG